MIDLLKKAGKTLGMIVGLSVAVQGCKFKPEQAPKPEDYNQPGMISLSDMGGEFNIKRDEKQQVVAISGREGNPGNPNCFYLKGHKDQCSSKLFSFLMDNSTYELLLQTIEREAALNYNLDRLKFEQRNNPKQHNDWQYR